MYRTGNDTVDARLRDAFFSQTRRTDAIVEMYSAEGEPQLLHTFGSEDEIADLAVSRGIQSDEDFIGCVISKEYKVRILDPDRSLDFTGRRLKPYIGVMISGEGTYVPFPAADVYEAEYDRVRKIWSVTCYDDMQKLNGLKLSDVDFSTSGDGGTGPEVITLSEYVSCVCRTAGLVFSGGSFFNSDMPVRVKDKTGEESDTETETVFGPNFSGSEYLREVISRAAQAALCNAVIDRSGQLAFVPVTADFDETEGHTFTADEYFSFTSDEAFGPVNTVVLSRSDLGDDIYYPDDDTAGSVYISDGVTAAEHVAEYGRIPVRIYDNPFLDRSTGSSLEDTRMDYAEAIFDMMKGRSYTAYNMDYRGTPVVDEGDRIRITDGNGNVIETLYFSDTLSYDGGLRGTSEGRIISQTAVEYEQSGSVQEKLSLTQIKVDRSEALIKAIVSSTADDDGNTSLELTQDMAALIARCIEICGLEKIILKAPFIELETDGEERSKLDLEDMKQNSDEAMSQLVMKLDTDIVYSPDEEGSALSREYTPGEDHYVGILFTKEICDAVKDPSAYEWHEIVTVDNGVKQGTIWLAVPSGYELDDLWLRDGKLYECTAAGTDPSADFEPYYETQSVIDDIRDDIGEFKENDVLGNIAQIKTVTDHLRFGDSMLKMFETQSGNGDEMQLSKTQLSFLNDGRTGACYGRDGLKAPDASLCNLVMSDRTDDGGYEGKWNWIMRSNGNLSLKWYNENDTQNNGSEVQE